MEDVNVNQESVASSPQEYEAKQSAQVSVNQSPKNKPLLIVGVALGFLLFGVGGYYLRANSNTDKTNNDLVASLAPTSTPNAIVPTESPPLPSVAPTGISDVTVNWNTSTNSEYGFTIKYPKKIDKYPESWQHEEYGTTDFGVGFGTPSSKSGGYIWGVSVYVNGDMEALIKQMGSQFSDRKESRQDITINGVPALLVTVTTNQYPGWVSKNVYIQRNGRVYIIGNGAIGLSEFDLFYNSFQFIQ